MRDILDIVLVWMYVFVWIATFAWYHIKQRSLDAGSTIMATYILYALVSVYTLNDPMFQDEYKELHLIPYIYLYAMLMLALSPTIYNHLHPTDSIVNPFSRVPALIAVIVVLCSVAMIPDLLGNFQQGIIKLFLDSDAGKDAYMEQLESTTSSGTKITNLFSIIFNSLYDITIFLFFWFLTQKGKQKLYSLLLTVALIMGMLQPIMVGQRTGVINAILTTILAYYLFKRYLGKRVNALARKMGVVMIILIMAPVVAITVSRFSDRTENNSAGVESHLAWYVGQGNLYFNNYALDDGGIRNGDRTANLFKRLIDPDTPANYFERRSKYTYLDIDDNLFVTFVGDFCIDYGPLFTIVIFVFFNLYVLINIRPHNKKLELHQLFLLYFTMCICMQGGMYLFAYSDTQGLKIVTAFLFYVYLRYHSVLLKRFPLKKKTTAELTAVEKSEK